MLSFCSVEKEARGAVWKGATMENRPPYQPDQPGEFPPEHFSGQQSAQAGEHAQARHPRLGLRFRRRPCGVVLMSLFLLGQGIFLLISGAFGFLGLFVLFFDASRGVTLFAHGVTSFALGFFSIIFAFALFMLARWAFWCTIVIAFLILAENLAVLIQTSFSSFGHIICGIFSLIILCYFLLDADARAAFTSNAPMVEV